MFDFLPFHKYLQNDGMYYSVSHSSSITLSLYLNPFLYTNRRSCLDFLLILFFEFINTKRISNLGFVHYVFYRLKQIYLLFLNVISELKIRMIWGEAEMIYLTSNPLLSICCETVYSNPHFFFETAHFHL